VLQRVHSEMDNLESKFYEYMYSLGEADEDWSRKVLQFYVPHFAHCRHVLDVGCGNGQLIELLTASGVEAVGIDLDTQMVESCREKGLQVVKADLFDYLPQQRGQFDGIVSSNVIEHFSVQDALRFLQLAFDALRPGGVLLVATPNPESLIVHLHEFWRDVTHVRLYNRSLLEFLLSWCGFRDIQSGGNPRTAWTPPDELRGVPKLLEDLPLEEPRQPGSGTILEAGTTSKDAERQRPLWRRVAFFFRRRLARFLARTVLYEEFSAIERALIELAGLETDLRTVTVTSQQVGRALYQSQSKLLTVPREVFAVGSKPSSGREGSG